MNTPLTEKATFGAGCFWCTEAAFQAIDGVLSVKPGYEGGRVHDPDYEQVCGGDTGHAEVVEIEFDPAKVSFDALLEVFWRVHDPTTLNRQGADVGTQYRSVIFCHTDQQREAAERSREAMNASGRFEDPIVTEIRDAEEFYAAEAYHRNYYRRNPLAPYSLFIRSKLKKLGLGG